MSNAYLNMSTGFTTNDMSQIGEWLDHGDQVEEYGWNEAEERYVHIGSVKRIKYPRRISTRGNEG